MMKIEKILNQIAQENTYFLSNAHSCLVIDPGSDSSVLTEILAEKLRADGGKVLSGILLTHAHFDHIMGLSALKMAFPDVPIYLHEAEKDWMKHPELNASLFMLGQPVTAPDADEFYPMGQELALGDFHFRVLETPGHSIGGVSLIFDDEQVVFTGDALFKNGIGRWDLPTGNQAQLLESIRSQLFSLPDEYQVLPGHGEVTSIGTERMYNPFF